MITISIDAMGGDHGVATTVPACLEIRAKHPQVRLILVGEQDAIATQLAQSGAKPDERLQVEAATQVVMMRDTASFALRQKKDSSMRVALNLVKNGRADACISAGNTGALLATARFVLKTIPGIARPAICTALPRRDGGLTFTLDLGANIDCSAQVLFQFGVMGAKLVQCLGGKKSPSVGLLNIGVEDIKGSEVIKDTAALFARSNLNYVGFVEGDCIYLGDTDVVVCDGFVGNAMLKAAEGVAQMIMGGLREEFGRDLFTRGCALFAKPVLSALRRRFDHRRYNGASLLGLRGAVVKSHGSADAHAFRYAVEFGILEVRRKLVSQISDAMAQEIQTGALAAN